MKKIATLALCMLTLATAGAQKATVDKANKLAGKTDQITEARALIQEAIANPETANDARTYFTAGKIEWDAYDKIDAISMVNPGDPRIDPLEMGKELVNGYNYFMKVLPLDSLPNAKGEVKPKYSKDIVNKVAAKHEDFFRAGANLFNAKDYYPAAYEAFMIYGDLPEAKYLGKKAPVVPDSVRSTSYFNAGLCAWSANKLPEAAKAFKAARLSGYDKPECYIYELAAYQNLQRDSTLAAKMHDNIVNVSKAGFEKFGMSQPVFMSNLIQSMIDENKTADALATLDQAIASNPDVAALYGLRAFVYNHDGKDDQSVADYRKAAATPGCDFETMKQAANKIIRVGIQKLNDADPTDGNLRNSIKNDYFIAAKNIAEAADAMEPGDPTIANILDNINYSLETYFK